MALRALIPFGFDPVLLKANFLKRNRFEAGQAFENFGVGTQLEIVVGGIHEAAIAVGLPHFARAVGDLTSAIRTPFAPTIDETRTARIG